MVFQLLQAKFLICDRNSIYMSLVVIDPFNQIAKTLGMKQNFTGNFTQQEPIPTQGIEAAIAVMQSGRIHRYNVVGDDIGETASLELEFAEYVGSKYCLAVASGGMPWPRQCVRSVFRPVMRC